MSITSTIKNWYLRPAKAQNLDALYSTYLDLSGKLNVRQYKNTCIAPIGIVGEGFLSERDNWILDDCNFVTEIRTETTPSNIRNERVLFCGYMRYEWGHFITNSMSRLWFFLYNPTEKFDKLIFCLPKKEEYRISGNYKEVLSLLGILDKIEFISTPTAFREIIVPDLSWSLQHHFSNEFNIVYDTIIAKVTNNYQTQQYSFRKVFLTRSQLEKARLSEIGIEMLDDFFLRNGYEIIAPEKYSLSELIMILHNADIIAGASGTTVHNILFGKKGQKLIIAERNVINNDFQPGLNLSRNLDVTYIDSFLTVNSVNSGLGPFLYYFTPYMAAYANDNKLKYPNDSFTGNKYLKKCLKKYFNVWNKFYGRQWYFQKCALPEIEAFHEAYTDSLSITGRYLIHSEPLYFKDYFNVSKIIKRNLKSSNPLYKLIKNRYSYIRP